MDWISAIGFSAALFTTVCQLPQMIKVMRTKDVSGLSLLTYVILGTGIALWMIYGILISDLPLSISNFFILLMILIIIIYKIRFG